MPVCCCQGSDHIFLFSHDEGACWAPTEVYNTSIILTHWGRLDQHHTSGSAFHMDNYTQERYDSATDELKRGWQHLITGHPCYTPGKVSGPGGPGGGERGGDVYPIAVALRIMELQ